MNLVFLNLEEYRADFAITITISLFVLSFVWIFVFLFNIKFSSFFILSRTGPSEFVDGSV